jgi:hypothetical protein
MHRPGAPEVKRCFALPRNNITLASVVPVAVVFDVASF